MLLALVLTLSPSAAQAQLRVREKPRAGSVEVSGSATFSGGYNAGTSAANETRNPSTGSDPLSLFHAESSLGRAPGADVRLGVYVTPRISVEGGLQFSRSVLRARLTGDFESAPEITAEHNVTQYVVDGSGLYHFGRFGGGRGVGFVLGGAGYVRELFEGNASVQTGSEFHGGGGIKYWLGGGKHRIGVRAEGRASSRDASTSLGGAPKRRLIPSASGGIVFLF